MQRLLTRIVLLTLAVASGPLLGQGAAYADTICQRTDPQTGICLIRVETPGDPDSPDDLGPKDSGSGHACFWEPKKQGLEGPPAGPVDCNTDYGYWSNHYNCYIRPLSPQPPAGDPARQGHQPGDGAVYTCFQPQTGIDLYIWSQNPPPGSSAGPTPRQVAELAIDQMNLRAVDIGITPRPGVGSVGIVGMPVWMWAANPDSHTVGPITASASGGGITVTATARVHRITWVMGDGHKVVCRTAGKPYKTSYGNKQSPDCGHVYEKSSANKPGNKFAVTAASDWVITWAGAGQTGTIRLNGLQRSVQIAVGEAQVLVR